MALGVIAEHIWHGNPRPIETYSYTLSDPAVTNPVTGYKHLVTINSSVPITDLAPSANVGDAGPDLLVFADVEGLWADGAGLNVGITVTGGTNISTSIVNGLGTVIGPDAFASQVAGALNVIGAGDVQCSSSGNVIFISALAGVTALTITTWAVAV